MLAPEGLENNLSVKSSYLHTDLCRRELFSNPFKSHMIVPLSTYVAVLNMSSVTQNTKRRRWLNLESATVPGQYPTMALF